MGCMDYMEMLMNNMKKQKEESIYKHALGK